MKPEQSQRAPGGYKNNNYTSVIRNEVLVYIIQMSNLYLQNCRGHRDEIKFKTRNRQKPQQL